MNKIKEKIPNYKVYLIAISVLIIDQITKILVMNNMNLGEEITIIDKFFSLIYLTNTGAAFSTFENQRMFIIIASVFCSALIISLMQKEKDMTKLKIISFGILIGGMFSNLIDRVIYKHVIDFFAFTIFSYRFPIFNIADIGITIGVFLYLILSLKSDKEEIKKVVKNK